VKALRVTGRTVGDDAAGEGAGARGGAGP